VRVALVTAGTRGDVQPMVALGVELERRGHDVIVGVPPNLTDFPGRAGLTALPIGADSREFLESPDGRAMLAAGTLRTFLDALGKIAHETFPAMTADTLRVCAGADLIVTGVLREDCAVCIGEASGVPVVALHTSPHRPTRAYPNYLVTTRGLPGPLNRATATLFERTPWRRMRSDINDFRSQLGLAPTRRPTPARIASAGLLELQAYSRLLVPRLDDYGPRRPLVGFLSLDAGTRRRLGEAGVDDDLDAWLTAGDPPVYFGFGSMPVEDPAAALGMITKVSRSLGVRALVGAGWGELGAGARQGEQVRIAGALDHTAVLPRCQAAVHHGGAGTTAATLAAGLPTLICSVFADQPFWGTRLDQLGVGGHCRFAALDLGTLESGLGRLLNPKVRQRARRLGGALATEDGAVVRSADLIERAA